MNNIGLCHIHERVERREVTLGCAEGLPSSYLLIDTGKGK